MSAEEYPCPCNGCDRFTLSPDAYCVVCMHHDCALTNATECSEGSGR